MNIDELKSLPALSIRQPWAYMIVRPDLTNPDERCIKCKRVENRTWNRSFRGRFLIHASKGMTLDEFNDAMWFSATIPFGHGYTHTEVDRSKLKFGGIIGYASITGVLPPTTMADRRNHWHMPAQYGYILEDINPLPFIPCRGMLGFFKPDLPKTP